MATGLTNGDAEVFAVWTLSTQGGSSKQTGTKDGAYCGGDALWTGMAQSCEERCRSTAGCRGFVSYSTGTVHADSNCQLTGSRCTIPRLNVDGCGVNIWHQECPGNPAYAAGSRSANLWATQSPCVPTFPALTTIHPSGLRIDTPRLQRSTQSPCVPTFPALTTIHPKRSADRHPTLAAVYTHITCLFTLYNLPIHRYAAANTTVLGDPACDSAVAHTLLQSPTPPAVVFANPAGAAYHCYSVYDVLGSPKADVCAGSDGTLTVPATEAPVYLVGKS
jgi:hypothetical protein